MAGLLTLLGSSVAAATSSPVPRPAVAVWQQALKQLPVPAKGCFAASYPTIEWREAACHAAPPHPYPPAHGHPAQVVGNGVDYSAEVSGGPLNGVTGSFPSVSAGATETGQQFGSGGQIANTFSLQLNAKPFTSPECAGAGSASCLGWQQFLYSTTYNEVFMQYWLENYDAACPAGWNTYPFGSAIYCWTNSAATPLAGSPLTVSQLPTTDLTGATAGGGNDSVTLSTGSGTAVAVGADSLLDISADWTGVEFAIVGDCCGSEANFSPGTSITVQTTTHNGATTAPTCVYEGFTGETNNLNLAATPTLAVGPSPALISVQSTSSSVPSCSAAHGIGDTHIATFGNTLYDFQASGDFELAQVSPQFNVVSRQVSGAPTWPNAAVNQAIAAQVDGADVAVCTAPTRLVVNNKTARLATGGQLALPGGGEVSRSGSNYLIQDTAGDSVNALVNTGSPDWINATVGLGRWPEPVSGLLANAGSNPSALVTSGGVVLNAPFAFGQFYDQYAESWWVPPAKSLLSACGSGTQEINPTNVFYSNDLKASVAKAAQKVCTAAGVKAAPLLDACTVDVAVLGKKGTASAYQSLPAKVTWGQIDPPANVHISRR